MIASASSAVRLQTRPASMADLEAIVAVERNAWPSAAAMRASTAKLKLRIELGCLLVTCTPGGAICGFLSTFRPHWAEPGAIAGLLADCPSLDGLGAQDRWDVIRTRARLPRDWSEATDDGWLGHGEAHTKDGPVVFGIGLTTDPRYQGLGVARHTLRSAFMHARRSGGRLFVGYGRLPHYERCPSQALSKYVARTIPRGTERAPWDPGLRLHWREGARPLGRRGDTLGFAGIPNAMRDDTASRDCGALIVTPLRPSLA